MTKSERRALLGLLRRAMTENREITGVGAVLDGKPAVCELRDGVGAPIMLSRAEYEGDWPPQLHAAPDRVRLERFEKLSLAARLKTAADDAPGGNDPEATRLAGLIQVNLDGFPEIPADLLVEVVTEMAARLNAPDATAGGAGEHLNISRGLHVAGARITGDLTLVNLKIPFSLRLRGCVIDGAVILDHSSLRTFDISGCAVRGVYATFVQVGGNVRMRRTASIGPVDFGGAHISGVLDMTDSVISPFAQPPSTSAFAGDRGVLNLSLTNVENEFRANRMRVYGGMAMKGAIIHRSMFMERASLHAPIATVEKMACQELDRIPGQTVSPGVRAALDSMRSDLEIAALLHDDPHMRSAETYGMPGYASAPLRQTVLYRLLAESTRARNSALRADGAKIYGSVFARGLVSAGRLRIKYATITGGLHLGGATLRSHAESEQALASLQASSRDPTQSFVTLARESKARAEMHEKGEGDHFALDIRDTRIGGDLNFDPFNFGGEVAGLRTATIYGSIQADQVAIDGGLCLREARFEPSFEKLRPKDQKVSMASLSIRQARIGGDLHLENARGVRSINAAHLRLGGNLTMTPDERARRPNRRRVVGRCEITGAVTLRNAVIGGDATLLFRGDGEVSLRLRYARFEGCLNILTALPASQEGVPGPGRFDGTPSGEDKSHAGGESLLISRDAYDKQVATAAKARAQSEPRWRNRRCKPDDIVELKSKPYIDLRSANAKAFRHAPGAWPTQNNLKIRGFVYESIRRLGPLGPFSGAPKKADTCAEIRMRSIGSGLIGLAVFLAALGALLGAWVEFTGPSGKPVLAFLDQFGVVNLGLLTALLAATAGLWILSEQASPTASEARPMGIDWLLLQEFRPNPFRNGRNYVTTDPYLQAARALRSAGRSRSADLIEHERMIEKQKTLSRRHHGPLKLLLWAVDALSGYGFRVPRTALLVAGLVLISAVIFEYARHLGWLAFVGEGALSYERQFFALAYVADLMIPFYSGGEASDWVVAYPEGGDPPTFQWLLALAAPTLRIAGLLLTTIVVMAVGSRIESFLSRMRD